MSVRHEKRRDPSTGTVRLFWMVDVKVRMATGRPIRVRRVSPVQTKRGGEAFERQLREKILNGAIGADGKDVAEQNEVPTLEKFSKEFLLNYAKANNKPSEVSMKTSILGGHLVPALGKKRLDEIDPRAIEGYKAKKLAEKLHPKTVNNHLTVLRKLLVTAVEWRLLGHTPLVKWLKVPKPKFDFLTFEESPRLVAAAKSGWSTMMLVALRTGLRIGELRALRWEDVDLVAGRIVVSRAAWKNTVGTPKNGRTREIPLSPDALGALQAHRHLRGPFVFCEDDGAMLTENAVKHPLWRACRMAGLREIGWHVLRHTFASQLVMTGVPLKAVQELMGHTTMEMTMRYAHLAPEVRNEAVTRLDNPAPLHGRGNLGATETA